MQLFLEASTLEGVAFVYSVSGRVGVGGKHEKCRSDASTDLKSIECVEEMLQRNHLVYSFELAH